MKRVELAALAASAALTAFPAAAAVELDQASVPETGSIFFPGYYVMSNSGQRAFEQTFTVGKAGVLDRIEVAAFNNPVLSELGDFILELFVSPVDFNLGSPTPLASQVIPMADLPETFFFGLSDFAVFDVSAANIRVNVGDTLTFSLRGGAGGSIMISPSGYAGGQLYQNSVGPFPSFGIVSSDLAFRTYVAVPEPATWALLIAGFGLAGSALRRRALA